MADSSEEKYQLVLASASPRRLELLRQIGVIALVHPVHIDEAAMSGEAIVELTIRLALEKARAGREAMIRQGINLPVLGSDTLVEIDGTVLGKPEDEPHAIEMLSKLSGKTHNVHTAVALVSSNTETADISNSTVEFGELSADVITAYVRTGEPLDKAGGYAIQGLAGQFVKVLHGSYSGVMGLPLFETARMLAANGIKTL